MSKRIYPTKGELKMLQSYSNELAIHLAVDIEYDEEHTPDTVKDVKGKQNIINKGLNDWIKTIQSIKKEKKVKY